jgi:(5-formylfuran-3-yl)methyl phosphate synthase
VESDDQSGCTTQISSFHNFTDLICFNNLETRPISLIPLKALRMARHTQLLVSVRDPVEAKTAMLAGAGIIDAKNPDAGALGRCSPHIWQEIRNKVGGRCPVSAALGEWYEWQCMDDMELQNMMKSLDGYQFVKLGPARTSNGKALAWADTIKRLRNAANREIKWIAVIYADATMADSIDRYEILEHSVKLKLDGILIDTFSKTNKWTWNHGWARFCEQVASRNLNLALAGGMNKERIKIIGAGQADWFAVRGAACLNGNRNLRVSFRKTNELSKIVRNLNPASS